MLLDWVLGLFSNDMAIDLGTANALVSVAGRGIVLDEPTVVAVKRGTREVLLGGNAVGSLAKAMVARTPPNVEAVRPLRSGRIADFDLTEAMLAYFIRRVHDRKLGVRPRVLIAVPSGLTAVEKRAVYSSAERAGARKVYLVSEPRAAGLGAGLPIEEPQGSMVVDIGGGTTEIAVLSLGDIVVSESLRTAGDDFDDAIVEHLKRQHNLFVGHATAEQVKLAIGSVWPLDEELDMDVCGRDAITGLPRMITIASEDVREALRRPAGRIVAAIRGVLERTSPELCGDLCERGIALCGGSSLIRGMDTLITQETGLPVERVEDPKTCVARGTDRLLQDLGRYAGFLETEDAI